MLLYRLKVRLLYTDGKQNTHHALTSWNLAWRQEDFLRPALGLAKWIPTGWVDLVREMLWWWVSAFSADVLMVMAEAATPCPWKMLAIPGLQDQK